MNTKIKEYLLKHTKLDKKFIDDFLVVTHVDYKKNVPLIPISIVANYLDINQNELYEMIQKRFIYTVKYYDSSNISGLGLLELCIAIDTKISNELAKKYMELYKASNKYYDNIGDKF